MTSLHPYQNPPPPGVPTGSHLPPPPPLSGAYPPHTAGYGAQGFPRPYGPPGQAPHMYGQLPGPPPGAPSGAYHPASHGPRMSHHSSYGAHPTGPSPAQYPTQSTGTPLEQVAAHQHLSEAPAPSQLPGRENDEERNERKRKEHEQKEHEKRKQEERRRLEQQKVEGSDHLRSNQVKQRPPHGRSGLPGPGGRELRQERKPGGQSLGEPKAAENRLKRPSTFLCKIRFSNDLPEPASQPKLLQINQDRDRYTKYCTTSLDRRYKYKLHVEPDLGIPLDLLDMSVYNAPDARSRPPLDPEDEALLRDDMAATPSKAELKIKERPTDKGLNWLVHTQYISPMDLDMAPKKNALNEKEAKRLALEQELQRDEEEFENSKEGQVRSIQESFRLAQEIPVHPTNPALTPVEILPILPSIDRLGDNYLHLVFDDHPMDEFARQHNLMDDVKDQLEARAIMKAFRMPGVGDAQGQPFMAYMAPSVLEDMDDDQEVAYEWIREYHYTRTQGEAGREMFLFTIADDQVSYLPLNTKLAMRKLKAHEGKSKGEEEREEFPIPSKVMVRKREMNEAEEEARDMQRRRLMEGDDVQEDATLPARGEGEQSPQRKFQEAGGYRRQKEQSDEDSEGGRPAYNDDDED